MLCALAAAGLALTAGLGLLAFAKYYSFIFLGRAREKLGAVLEPSRWPGGMTVLAVILLFLGTIAPWEIHVLASGLEGLLGFNAASAVLSHPLVLGPVFKEFSVLAPTWLSIVLPAYALIAFAVASGSDRRRGVRRAPVWVTGSGAHLAAVQYRPSAYSNPMRVILRGPLGYRSRLIEQRDTDGRRRLILRTTVVFAIDRFVYQPTTRLALTIAELVRATQSGRLSSYLLYMLVALIVALSLVPILS